MPSGNLNDEIDLCIAALHAMKVIAAGHTYQSAGFQTAVADLADTLERNAGGHAAEPRAAQSPLPLGPALLHPQRPRPRVRNQDPDLKTTQPPREFHSGAGAVDFITSVCRVPQVIANEDQLDLAGRQKIA